MHEFKPGDKVYYTKWIGRENHVLWLDSMDQDLGKQFTILRQFTTFEKIWRLEGESDGVNPDWTMPESALRLWSTHPSQVPKQTKKLVIKIPTINN